MDARAWIRNILVELFKSQLGAARELQFAERTVRYWCQHGAPPHVERTLRQLKLKKITLRHAREIMHEKRERRPNRAAPAASAGEIHSSN